MWMWYWRTYEFIFTVIGYNFDCYKQLSTIWSFSSNKLFSSWNHFIASLIIINFVLIGYFGICLHFSHPITLSLTVLIHPIKIDIVVHRCHINCTYGIEINMVCQWIETQNMHSSYVGWLYHVQKLIHCPITIYLG